MDKVAKAAQELSACLEQARQQHQALSDERDGLNDELARKTTEVYELQGKLKQLEEKMQERVSEKVQELALEMQAAVEEGDRMRARCNDLEQQLEVAKGQPDGHVKLSLWDQVQGTYGSARWLYDESTCFRLMAESLMLQTAPACLLLHAGAVHTTDAAADWLAAVRMLLGFEQLRKCSAPLQTAVDNILHGPKHVPAAEDMVVVKRALLFLHAAALSSAAEHHARAAAYSQTSQLALGMLYRAAILSPSNLAEHSERDIRSLVHPDKLAAAVLRQKCTQAEADVAADIARRGRDLLLAAKAYLTSVVQPSEVCATCPDPPHMPAPPAPPPAQPQPQSSPQTHHQSSRSHRSRSPSSKRQRRALSRMVERTIEDVVACVRLADAERQQLRDAVEGFASEDDQLELLQAVKMLCNVKTPTYRVRQRIDALRKSRFVDLHRDVQQRIKELHGELLEKYRLDVLNPRNFDMRIVAMMQQLGVPRQLDELLLIAEDVKREDVIKNTRAWLNMKWVAAVNLEDAKRRT